MNLPLRLIFLLKLANTAKKLRMILAHCARKTAGLCSPAAATIAVTGRCNFNCRHCAVDGSRAKAGELALRDVEKILRDLGSLKVPRIYFGGGEPLMHPDIAGMIGMASGKGFITFLETNGYLLADETAVRSLKAAGLSCVCLSLHAASRDEHDGFCGMPGSFERVMRALELCVQHGLLTVISVVATKRLIKDGVVADIISLARAKGAGAVRLTAPHSAGRWLDFLEPIGAKDMNGLTAIPSFGLPVFNRVSIPRCSIGSTLYINPRGEVQPCEFIPYSFGNVLTDGMDQIIRGMRTNAMFKSEKPAKCRIDDAEFHREYIAGLAAGELPVKVYK
ncbi:MAG: radical SAM protein [Elusimicrobiota bacterium]